MKEEFRPEDFGIRPLPIPVPPLLETAFGYPGDRRYVAFHECRISTPGFFVEDAVHQSSGVEAGWSLFSRHAAVSRALEAIGVDLKRSIPVIPADEWIAMGEHAQDQVLSRTNSLLLDRNERRFYVGLYPNVMLFLATGLASEAREFGSEDMMMSDEDVPNATFANSNPEPKPSADRPADVSRAVLEDLRSWLDRYEPLDDDGAPGPVESCGFRNVQIRVDRGQIEAAFCYRGGKRYITLHWSPKANKVFICDGIERRFFSDAVDTWYQFLDHPLVNPHLQGWDANAGACQGTQLDFAGRVGELPESPLFANEEAARAMEADVITNCFLYDRANNELYVGTWASALLFHSLVDDGLEEDLVADTRSAPPPLIDWLNERLDDPEQAYAVAAAYNQYQRQQEALEMLERCIALEPHSHLYWCRFSQTLGSLARWEEALDAIETAIGFHAVAQRQYVKAAYMLKWKATCLASLGRYSEAADTYRFAIEVDETGNKADVYAQIAKCYEQMGAHGDAIRARELQVRERADLFRQAERGWESQETEKQILESERFFLGEAWLDLGRCYARADDVGAAEWAFSRAIETSGNCIRARAELGALLQRLGRAKEADCHLAKALALATAKVAQNPTLTAHSDLAFVYRALGMLEKAEQAERRVAESKSGNAR